MQGGVAMTGPVSRHRLIILAVVVAVVLVLVAKYFGLLHGPVILSGQGASLVS
jgi:hypothetical protein